MSRRIITAIITAGMLTAAGCSRSDSSKSPTAAESAYVACRTTGVVHRRDCGFVNRSLPANRIEFNSLEAARSEGYRPCERCLPHAPPAAADLPEFQAILAQHGYRPTGGPVITRPMDEGGPAVRWHVYCAMASSQEELRLPDGVLWPLGVATPADANSPILLLRAQYDLPPASRPDANDPDTRTWREAAVMEAVTGINPESLARRQPDAIETADLIDAAGGRRTWRAEGKVYTVTRVESIITPGKLRHVTVTANRKSRP